MKLTIENKIKEGVQKCVTEWNWKIRLDQIDSNRKTNGKGKLIIIWPPKEMSLRECFYSNCSQA